MYKRQGLELLPLLDRQRDPMAYVHETLDPIDEPASSNSRRLFTEKQGQYLAFIHTYILLNRQPPAEADFQRFFGVTPPAVHQMILELERRGLIGRVPHQPRTISLRLPVEDLPRLLPINSSASGY